MLVLLLTGMVVVCSVGALDWCEYWRLLGRANQRPECSGIPKMGLAIPTMGLAIPTVTTTEPPSSIDDEFLFFQAFPSFPTLHPTPIEPFGECGPKQEIGCVNCEPSCANPRLFCDHQELCTEGCTCLDGFVRDRQDRCIPLRSCPIRNLVTERTFYTPFQAIRDVPICPRDASVGLVCTMRRRADSCSTHDDCNQRTGRAPRMCCRSVCGNRMCHRDDLFYRNPMALQYQYRR